MVVPFLMQTGVNRISLFWAGDGPFKFMLGQPDTGERLINLCKNKDLHTPIIKFTRYEREFLDKTPDFDCIYKVFA